MSDDSLDTAAYLRHLITKGESLEGLLTVLLCEVHNQMPHVEGNDKAPVSLAQVRKPASNIDPEQIARVIEECIPDPATGAQLLTLALLNMLGAVEW
jgi:hypothetical protein